MLVNFDHKYHGFIRVFFNDSIIYLFIEPISYNGFFEFICLMIFFDFDRITTVFLIACGVYSNVFLSQTQISVFLNKMYLRDPSFNKVFSDLNNLRKSNDSNTYELKYFVAYLKSSKYYQDLLISFRYLLINMILSNKVYYRISQRYNFYYLHPTSPPPPEKCFSGLTRKMFTNEPPPYHYDFRLKTPGLDSFNYIIVEIRKQIGGSKAHCSIRTSKMKRPHLSGTTSNYSHSSFYNSTRSSKIETNKLYENKDILKNKIL